MKFFASSTILSVSTLLLRAQSVSAAPDAAPVLEFRDLALNTSTSEGCYSSIPDFTDLVKYTYQSTGYCQKYCVTNGGYAVFALLGGGSCACGNQLPPESAKIENSACSVPCDGFPQEMCGGSDNAYGVFLSGTTPSVPTAGSSAGSSSSKTTGTPSTAGAASVVTEAGKTIVVTAASQTGATAESSSGGGSNKAGIAAGVVVGVVVLSALVGGAFFFFRRQKRRAVEEEYRRNAAINNFVHPNKPSMTSSGWDGDYMAQRRQSNGSIADDEDFSRRILQVTNPDR